MALVETMITHVDCWDDKRRGGLIPLAFPFIFRRFKVTNMFYSVVCRNSTRGDVDRLKKGIGGTGPGLSSLFITICSCPGSISHVLLFLTSPPVTGVLDVHLFICEVLTHQGEETQNYSWDEL